LLMDNNGTTETIYDDVITMTHYAGTFEGWKSPQNFFEKVKKNAWQINRAMLL
jgi:hypothetical protein